MTQKQNIRLLLIIGLIAGSLGGWLLHVRIHAPANAAMNLIPFITGLISIIIIPILFLFKVSMPYAYVMNGMLAIIGVITMAHVSIMHLPAQVTFVTLVVGTLLADIFLLLTNFFFGKALFELEMFKTIDASIRKGRIWRYPNMGWWGVHLFALSIVYSLGNQLWK
jgi:hypothetical protein